MKKITFTKPDHFIRKIVIIVSLYIFAICMTIITVPMIAETFESTATTVSENQVSSNIINE